MTQEVGSGQVAIFPTFKGFRSKTDAEFSGAGRAGGRTFSSAFNAGVGDPGAAVVKKLNAQIASGSKALSSARLAEQDAAGKVRVAETALAEARAKGGAQSSRSVAAEERLNSAQRNLATAQDRTRTSSDALKTAQGKLAEATSSAGSAGEQSANRFSRGWATLKSKITGQAKEAVDGAGEGASKSADQAGKKSGGAFTTAFKGAMGALAGVFAAQQIGSFFKSSVAGAADLEQSVGAIDAVFKGSASQMHAWADSAATDVGLSKNEFNELGTLIGAQLKNGGTAMEELGPKTNDLIGLGADLASMFGGTTKDAVGALSSALKGERDPIERYGVSLNQAKIDAEAASLGFEKVGGSLSSEANQAATLSLILKQTADAHGNFASESDTLAHKQQVLNAQIKNGKDRIGNELLPVVSAFTGLLSRALGPAIDLTVKGIGGIVGAGRGLYDLFAKGDFTGAFRDAFKVEEDSRVVGFLFGVRDAAMQLWAGLSMGRAVRDSFAGQLTGIVAFGASARATLDEITGGFRAFKAAFVANDGDITSSGFPGMMEVLGNGARNLFNSIGPLVPQIVSLWTSFSPLGIILAAITPLLPELTSMFGLLASTIGSTLSSVITLILPLMLQLSGVISQALGSVLAAVIPAAVQLITMLGTTISELLPVIVPIIATILQLAATLIGQLAPILTQLISSILPPVIAIFGLVLGAIAPLVQLIAAVLIPVIQALMPVVVTVFAVIADVISAAMQIILGIIQVVTGIISGDWSKVWQGMGNILSGVWNLIVSIIRGALQIVGQVVISGLALIGNLFITAWNSITQGASGMAGDLLGFFGGLPGRILGTLGNLGGLLLGAGQALIQGFINGIKGMVGAIGDAVGGVLDFAKQFFPHSPAKRGPFSGRGYTSFSGQALAEDFAGGMDSRTRLVAGSAERLMRSAALVVSDREAVAVGVGQGRSSGSAAREVGSVTYNNTFNELSTPRATALQVLRIQEEG